MPSRKRHRRAGQRPFSYLSEVIAGLDASRRVGFALYYDKKAYADQLERVCEILRDRVEVILPELFQLVDAVLHDRNIAAFTQAYRIQQLVDSYMAGQAA